MKIQKINIKLLTGLGVLLIIAAMQLPLQGGTGQQASVVSSLKKLFLGSTTASMDTITSTLRVSYDTLYDPRGNADAESIISSYGCLPTDSQIEGSGLHDYVRSLMLSGTLRTGETSTIERKLCATDGRAPFNRPMIQADRNDLVVEMVSPTGVTLPVKVTKRDTTYVYYPLTSGHTCSAESVTGAQTCVNDSRAEKGTWRLSVTAKNNTKVVMRFTSSSDFEMLAPN